MSHTFGQELKRFALLIDSIDDKIGKEFYDLLEQYIRFNLGIEYFHFMIDSGMFEGRPSLRVPNVGDTFWSSTRSEIIVPIRPGNVNDGSYMAQCTYVYDTGQPIWVTANGKPLNNARQYLDAWSATADLPKYNDPDKSDVRTLIVVPLQTLQHTFGFMCLESVKELKFNVSAEEEIKCLAEAAGTVLNLYNTGQGQHRNTDSVLRELKDLASEHRASPLHRPWTDSAHIIPVRLGASVPKAVAPGSSFTARFVAYHPDLEAELTKQLYQWEPEATHRLDSARANWELGTRVKVRVYGEDLIVDPEEDEFRWGGEKHILDFRAKVAEEATGPRDLKFDVYVEDLRLSRIWIPVELSNEPADELHSRTVSSPRTAFASYASEDRPRVLDRVATLEIHCGLRVFLDCVSMRPNARWRELLPDMVLESDQLLLFWSKAARDSRWVDKEWRIAFSHKGIDGIEIHPLDTYEEARLPRELADLAHGADPMMVIRAHELRTRR